tara:strand:- start:66 stop:212 length:147 start_codon:yes stop_codon:yes gene_type:complete
MEALALPRGLEPLTYGLEDRCSNPTELRKHWIYLKNFFAKFIGFFSSE